MAVKTIATNFLVAQASALILNPETADELTVRGLTGLTLPLGFEMSTIVVSEMGRRIDLVVPSGGAYTPIDITANFVPGDLSQTTFQDAALNSTPLRALRFYLKAGCDFAALDLINDSGGAYYIGTFSPPSAPSKNELYQNQITILPAGSSVLFIAHSAPGLGANIDFTAEGAGGAVLELSAGTWAGFGFEEDDVIIVDNHTALLAPLYGKVETISGTTMTMYLTADIGVGDMDDITTVTGIAATQIHGATPIEVTSLDLTCE